MAGPITMRRDGDTKHHKKVKTRMAVCFRPTIIAMSFCHWR